MANNNAKLSLDELAQNYGYAANFFNSDPELLNLINQAVKNQWSTAMFQAKFIASNWYRTHAASVRQWIEESQRDPATAQRQIDQKSLDVQQMAYQMGATIDPGRLSQIAHDSLMWGWSDAELKSALASEIQYQPGQAQGTAASYENQIRQAANDYGVTISDDAVGTYIRHLSAGDYTMDNVNSQMRDWAMSKYPGLAKQLQEGYTVRQVADPYIQSYSSILEQPSGTVQLDDPLIQKALQGVPTPAGGLSASQGQPSGTPVAPQSLYDFETSLRKDPRWLSTKNAQQSMQGAAMGILRNWGLYS